MNKNTILLLVLLVALAVCYGVFFTHWFDKPTIQVLAQIRPTRNVVATPGLPATHPVSFAFDRRLCLTEIKVIGVDDMRTNRYPHPVWHLISDSNSVPRLAIIYGESIAGMKPKMPGIRPEPLLPDVAYRLFVRAGKHHGQIDFKALEAAEPADR